jgi:hypothetical protein
MTCPNWLPEAERAYGEIKEVGPNTLLMHPNDARRLIAACIECAAPCSRSQASSLVVELIGRRATSAKPILPTDPDFQSYSLDIHAAFAAYPFDIGERAVKALVKLGHFKPMHIVEFCEREIAKRHAARTMGERHLAESQRREATRTKIAPTPTFDYEARRRRVAEILSNSPPLHVEADL